MLQNLVRWSSFRPAEDLEKWRHWTFATAARGASDLTKGAANTLHSIFRSMLHIAQHREGLMQPFEAMNKIRRVMHDTNFDIELVQSAMMKQMLILLNMMPLQPEPTTAATTAARGASATTAPQPPAAAAHAHVPGPAPAAAPPAANPWAAAPTTPAAPATAPAWAAASAATSAAFSSDLDAPD